MREKVVNFIVSRSSCYKKMSKSKQEEIKYGMECFYTTITKLIAVVLISIVLKTHIQLVILILLFWPIRSIGFGFHAKNNLQCWIISIIMYSIFPVFIKFLNVPNTAIIIATIPLILITIIYSPAETKKKPLLNKGKNVKRKIAIVVISVLYLIFSVYLDIDIFYRTVFSVFLFQSFLTNPITYKLLE